MKGADYAGIIEKLERAKLPGAAEAFRSRCRAFLSWCLVRAKVIDQNPLYGYCRGRATRADRVARQQHGRALSDVELVAVWRAAEPGTSFGRLVRFLILTGCRRGEAAGLSRSMFDGRTASLVLPAAFVKQARPHTVPVTPALTDLLASCTVDARSDLYFPSARTGGPMSGWNKLVAALVKKFGVQFTPHDLRRTFRTGLSALAIDNDLAELALGHARTDLESRYDRHSFRDELGDAFEKWAVHVTKMVAAAEARERAAAHAKATEMYEGAFS